MPRISNKSATRIDKLIGEAIRVHRLSKGLTQGQLGSKLGVTFQQIQKYEKGTNRIGSGRLYQIAEIFEVPVTEFFRGEKAAPTRHLSPFVILEDPMSLELLKGFAKIRDKNTRRSVLALVEQMVRAGKR
jgi:transcriptional regulator with XRE-family HTH domain